MKLLKVKQAIIVEGKYDKIKLSSIIDGIIIQTDGYGIFKDKEKLDLIRFYANTVGIIILTDSDSAGFKIRNYIKGSIKDTSKIINVYTPDIFGKEKRKLKPSAEGKIGVEGLDINIILEAFKNANIDGISSIDENSKNITHTDLFELGLIGNPNSKKLRAELLKHLKLPERLTTSGLLDVLNTLYSLEDLKSIINVIKNSQ
ncbi:MAG: toprim domain-containing protein [Oscillospiraceae bacterium]